MRQLAQPYLRWRLELDNHWPTLAVAIATRDGWKFTIQYFGRYDKALQSVDVYAGRSHAHRPAEPLGKEAPPSRSSRGPGGP